MVMEVLHEEDNLQCTNHPFVNSSSPGGICAFCLQEKLGKLVSSFPVPIFPSSPSSRSEQTSAAAALQVRHRGAARLPSVLKRSKSSVIHFLKDGEDYRANKRGLWSFLRLTKPKKTVGICKDSNFTSGDNKNEDQLLAVDENQNDHQVRRSRSVGCGSRRFSGDFFGDCSTLRRVESHRENKSNDKQDCTKERVIRCGGIFSNLMIMTSSSSTDWVPSSNEDQDRDRVAGKSSGAITYGRGKSRGWAVQ